MKIIPAGEVGGHAKCCRCKDSSSKKQDPSTSQLLGAVEQLPVDEVDVGEEGGNEEGEEEREPGKLELVLPVLSLQGNV